MNPVQTDRIRRLLFTQIGARRRRQRDLVLVVLLIVFCLVLALLS